MKKRIILLLIIMLTVGYASVSVSLFFNGATTVAFDKNNLQVVFKRVRLNNEESENVIIDENRQFFVYIADDLTNVGDIANIEYDIKNESSIYDASVIVSCTTNYEENIEYTGNTLNQIVEINAGVGYTDTLSTKLTNVNTTDQSIALKCSLIVNPESRDTIMLGREYNVTLNANGGTVADSSIVVKHYEKYGELPTPTKAGYDFLGWYTEEREKINSNSLVRIKGNHTLKAGWKNPNLTAYEISYDIDLDGRADIGDEIKVGTEYFYVISQTVTELNALAKYNLNVGDNKNTSAPEGIQHEKMVGYAWQEGKKYGTVAFSYTSGWPNVDNATIDIRNESYRGGSTMTALDALYGENGYEKYIQQTIPNSSVRLITREEIENLINDGNPLLGSTNIEQKAKEKGYTWLYSTTYWTQSASYTTSSYYNYVWGVYSHGGRGAFAYTSNDSYSDKNWYGVRPVITIKVNIEDIFNVTFNANGGSVIDLNKEIKYGNKYGELPTPTHNNSSYTFTGWYTEGGEKIESTTIMKMYKDHTLTARWKTKDGYEISNDINKDGVVDIGDEISVGTENFYVISHNDTELNALAKYNLKVGNIYTSSTSKISAIPPTEEGYGRQDAIMQGYVNYAEKYYGTVAFSNQSGWSSSAPIDIRNDSHADGPVKDALYGEKGYEKYIQQIIQYSSVRLITKGEIENLINDGNPLSNYIEEKANAKGYPWLYSTSYWTQSPNGSSYLWYMSSSGSFYATNYYSANSYGVRPVITIPLT